MVSVLLAVETEERTGILSYLEHVRGCSVRTYTATRGGHAPGGMAEDTRKAEACRLAFDELAIHRVS
jgi:hypothetical protein